MTILWMMFTKFSPQFYSIFLTFYYFTFMYYITTKQLNDTSFQLMDLRPGSIYSIGVLTVSKSLWYSSLARISVETLHWEKLLNDKSHVINKSITYFLYLFTYSYSLIFLYDVYCFIYYICSYLHILLITNVLIKQKTIYIMSLIKRF